MKNINHKSIRAALLLKAVLFSITCIFTLSLNSCFYPEKVKKPHIVFLISEDVDNYEADRTIPVFTKLLKEDYQTTVLIGTGNRNSYYFPNLEVVKDADLLVVFCRRLALKPLQLNMIKEYLSQGKPLVGIRTANHAFSLREEIEEGYEDWWDFVPEILGCENRGYGEESLGTEVNMNAELASHPILQGVPAQWHSVGNVYKVAPLIDENALPLLTTQIDDQKEPIAWVRLTAEQGRVFYTSLGHPKDFEFEGFQQLLLNGIKWALYGE